MPRRRAAASRLPPAGDAHGLVRALGSIRPVRRARLPAGIHRPILILALLAGACSTPTPPPSPTGSPTLVGQPTPSLASGVADLAAQLESIALQPADLAGIGGEFNQFDFGRTASLDSLPPPQAAADRFGRIDGWKARYRRSSDLTTGVLVVDSRIDLFPDEQAATSDFTAYSERYATRSRTEGGTTSNPQVGDAATELVIVPADAASVRMAMIAWRRGPFTGQLVVSGLGDIDPGAAATTLATAVDQRMLAAAAEQ